MKGNEASSAAKSRTTGTASNKGASNANATAATRTKRQTGGAPAAPATAAPTTTGKKGAAAQAAADSKASKMDVISMGDDGYDHRAAPSLAQKVRVVPGKGDFERRYAQGKQLGLGAFSNVFLGVHRHSRGEYAIKKIDREKMIWGDSRDALEDEVNHLILAREGPNIVQLYEVYEEKVHCYLVMELMRGGELFDRILERKNFSEKAARDCIRGILTGIEFLHEKYVIKKAEMVAPIAG